MSTLRLLVLALALPLGGCATLGYYGQAISGHYSILERARSIETWLAEPTTAPDVKQKLARVLQMREFASQTLRLPDNDSYRRYADLERPYVVWNVYAAPELSLQAEEWCFLVVGCVSYRGYFTRADAERLAGQLRAEGYDVFVGGATAYSTLGWLDDPLLNTMIVRPEPELAGLIFHELAHQLLYVRDDTAFNESFATTVEHEGVRRWLDAHGVPTEYAAYLQRSRRREEFFELMLQYRTRLSKLYASDQDDQSKRASKRVQFAQLRHDYEQWKRHWGGYDGFDNWIQDVNNARLVSIGLYNEHIHAFQALLAHHGGDLPAFYAAVKELAEQPRDQRVQQLAELARQAAATMAAREWGTKN